MHSSKVFAFQVSSFRTDMANAIGNGTITEQTITAAAQRVVLSHMRLGLFDTAAQVCMLCYAGFSAQVASADLVCQGVACASN